MSDEEIKLTITNNTTTNGTPFPETPRPQIITESFSYNENPKINVITANIDNN